MTMVGFLNEALIVRESQGGSGRWLRMVLRWALLYPIQSVFVTINDHGRQAITLATGESPSNWK